MLSSIGVICVMLTILVIMCVVAAYKRYKSNSMYVMAPIHKPMVAKYFDRGNEWDLDVHNHIFRPIHRNNDATTVESLLGLLPISSNKPFNITIKPKDQVYCVMDVYKVNESRDGLGDLVFSIPQPSNVTIGRGEFSLPDQRNSLYLITLKVCGSLSKSWMRGINVKYDQWNSWTSLEPKQVYQQPIKIPPQVIPHIAEEQRSTEIGVYPPSSFIRKNIIKVDATANTKLCLRYTNKNTDRQKHSVITTQIIGTRVDEIYDTISTDSIIEKEWDMQIDREIVMVESVYGVDVYQRLNRFSVVTKEPTST